MVGDYGGYEKLNVAISVKDCAGARNVILILLKAKTLLEADAMRKNQSVFENYEITKADSQELRKALRETINYMGLAQTDLLNIITEASFFDVSAVMLAAAWLWAEKDFAIEKQFIDFEDDVKGAIISQRTPAEFMTAMSANEKISDESNSVRIFQMNYLYQPIDVLKAASLKRKLNDLEQPENAKKKRPNPDDDETMETTIRRDVVINAKSDEINQKW